LNSSNLEQLALKGLTVSTIYGEQKMLKTAGGGENDRLAWVK